MLDLRLFGGRMLACANLASFCNALARAALILVVALYFQAARGVDAFTAGLSVLPVPVGMALASPIAGALGRRVSPYALSIGGSLFSAAGLLTLMLTARPGTPYWIIGVGLFLAGCGSGTFLTGNTTQVMSALPAGSLGVVNGFRLMVMNVGVVISVGLSLTVLTSAVSPRAARPGVRRDAVEAVAGGGGAADVGLPAHVRRAVRGGARGCPAGGARQAALRSRRLACRGFHR
ncbi:hypothetical protein GCM10020219_009530 [Nonomuraea dietziae]